MKILNRVVKKQKFTPFHFIVVLSSIFVLLFLISIIIFLIDNGGQVRRVLFFPDKITTKLIGEERYIKKEKNDDDNIKELIREILLGPSLPGSSPVFPRETKLLSILLIQKQLYINFSKEIIFPDIKIPLDFYKGLDACSNSVKFNFPSLQNILFFVNGEEITQHPEGDSEKDKADQKMKFRTDLLK